MFISAWSRGRKKGKEGEKGVDKGKRIRGERSRRIKEREEERERDTERGRARGNYMIFAVRLYVESIPIRQGPRLRVVACGERSLALACVGLR